MSVLKECPSFKGVIYASNKGNIYKKNSKGVLKPLKQRYDKDGYLLVSFRINGVPYTKNHIDLWQKHLFLILKIFPM